MYTLHEIRSMLGSSEELRQKIVRSLGSSTVALFALFDNDGKESLESAGTGTLVTVGDSYYILTAAHVWEERLKSAVKVGITLTDNRDHKNLTEVYAIVPAILKPDDSKWNKWGPDLAMLRIPPARVGGIKACQVFEYLNAPPKHLNVDCLECWVAMGTPKELGSFTQNHAEVQISGRFLILPAALKYHHRGAYDYYDFQMDTTSPGMPKSFGGFSGGGLWRVMVYFSRETGKVDWAQRLKGVTFYEFPIKNGYRVLRSHGPESITTVVGMTVPDAKS
jgi:hypothetical protein